MFGPAARAPLATSVALLLLITACEEEAEPDGFSCQVGCGDASGPQLDAGTWQEAGWGSLDSGSSADSGAPAATLPCEIKTIVDSKCAQCHGEVPSFGAYMALANHAHFHAPGTTDKSKLYHQIAKTRLNLPVSDGRHMPPPNSPQLSAAELATFNGWLDQGAPAGSGCSNSSDAGAGDAGGDAGVIDTTGLSCYKLLARGTDLKPPFKVGVANDAYYNVRFTAPWQGTVYGIVIRPVIDNSKVIHHWLLFQDTSTGTPTGADKNGTASGAHPDGQLLAGWAPGSDAINFRDTGVDVGIELPPTSYTIEFHYNSSDASAVDASGAEICVQTKKPANIAALSWLGYDNAPLANGLPWAEPKTSWTGKCDPVSKEPIHILSVWPHMHLQGRRMKATINRKSGSAELLHDEPFNFDYQRSYNKRVTLQDGDTVTTECTYEKPSVFGKGTSEEMCYLFTLAYPKGALADNGAWGKTAHGGSACLGQ